MSTDAQPTTAPAVSPEWLQDRLQTLLNSPYIHFDQPKLPHLRMGHGPVDLFSTRFNNWFTSDATGVVAGSTVDKAGLKDALLALQRKWNSDTAKFTPSTSAQEGSLVTRCEFTPMGAQQPADITASASVRHEGGSDRISTLSLDGDASLFTN
ncbi:hypothetical protein FOMPIDRAFT_143163 [Fomitopsis schrenkii]|uniref:Uncharacterized protein n=1 Tax=Fomitopsis schrenkii TaxID=2126942 RepID=S8E7L2_FOMSC|nr:hypothetical protein FOMPIDRAFT_143163 [Fomitopsis schrenkii]